MIASIGTQKLHLGEHLEALKYQANKGMHNPHHDGWGLAYEVNGNIRTYKTTIAINKDPVLYSFYNIKTRFFIMHARKSSVGTLSKNNTHPFKYHNYVFAHNGTIKIPSALHPVDNQGTTDSETLFHYIVQQMNSGYTVVDTLKAILNMDIMFTSMNFFMGNTEMLYILRYTCTSKQYYTLYEGLIKNKENVQNYIYTTEKYLIKNITWNLVPNMQFIHIKNMTKTEYTL